MKNKYLLLSILSVFIALGIVSCKEDNVKDMPVELSIEGTQTAFEFSAMGGEQKVVLNSNYPWSAEMSPVEDSAWCKLKISEKELLICPQPNWETEVRSSKVKIFAGEGEKTKALYLDVVQKAGDKMSIMFSPEKVIFSPDAETREVMYMTANPDVAYKWQGDTLVNWVEIVLDKENAKFVMASKFNTELTGRRAVLEVSGGIGENLFTDTLSIEQMGNEPTIKLNPDTVRIGAMGGSVEIEVLSTVEEYKAGTPWWEGCTLTPKEGEADKFILSIPLNPEFNERTDRIWFGTPYGATPSVDAYLEIIQEKNVVAEISADAKVGFTATGGELKVPVTSSWETWGFSMNEEDETWCHVTREGAELKVAVDPYDEEGNRETVVTLTAGEGKNMASCEVIVTQLGTKPSLVLSVNRVVLDEQGNEVVVDVTTNAELWAPTLPEGDDNWCTVTPDFTNNQIKIKATPAEAGSRSVELVVEIPGTDVKVPLVIVQSKFYQPGDVYVVNGEPLGIVYEVSDGGAHGKVVGLKATRDPNIWYRTGLPYDEGTQEGVGVVARSETNGLENMKAYRQIANWKNHFQVAAHIDNMNDENGFPGWYLPSILELQAMLAYVDGTVLNPDGTAVNQPDDAMREKRKAFNQKIVDNGGDELYFYGYDPDFILGEPDYMADYYNRIWSSTETDYQMHPMVRIFFLRNGWFIDKHTYTDEPEMSEIRPFLAF